MHPLHTLSSSSTSLTQASQLGHSTMKIQCDVCETREAAIFCTADEAALCWHCDRRVHHANKLAEKHLRFPLLPPSPKDFPLCDICQERRAFLFCKEDRAVLCRECDVTIHRATEHTRRHTRFFLTGVKLATSPAAYPADTTSEGCGYATSYFNPAATACSDFSGAAGVSGCSGGFGCSGSPPSATTSYQTPCYNTQNQMGSDQEGSISTDDYDVADCYTTSSQLLTVGPDWHVEDLFDSAPDSFAYH